MSETGHHTRFRSLYRQSLPGSRVNEDACGLQGDLAWIVDGATGVSEGRIAGAESDAAWLARFIGDQLANAGHPDGRVDELLRQLEDDAAQAFARAAGVPVPEEAGPSACLGLISAVREPPGSLALKGFFLGDVVALVLSEGRVLRWTDERAKPFERRTLAALQDGHDRSADLPDAVRRQILENRTKLNHPDGYWVVNPLRPWAGRELRFSAPVEAGAPVVLATDGFMRLVDVFDAYTDDTLYRALAAGKGEELLGELRDRERRDETRQTFRRVKTHDDATVLVIAAEG
ncbi:hypothetical protein [Microvirga rosea]|uniref:hypothetical protein n=1 Tax=Microvirga rosea TaxID=2715425 RepID=UPI001D0AD1CA|nr:hypothetical protein [Microvirga rosea]MCB8821392.1 hypothetical protein [Microvirga rosea]